MRLFADKNTRLFAYGSLLLAIIMCLPLQVNQTWGIFDKWAFSAWVNWLPSQRASETDKLQLVHLPASLRTATQPMAENTEALTAIVDKLKRNKAAAIGLIPNIQHTLWSEQQLLALLPNNKRKGATSKNLLAPYQELARSSTDASMYWLHPGVIENPKAAQLDRQFRWPLLFNFHDWYTSQSGVGAKLKDGSSPLLVKNDEQLQGGFMINLLARMHRTDAIHWQLPDLLRVGEQQLSVSDKATIRPLPQQAAVNALLNQSIDPDDIAAENVAGKLVLLGYADDPATEQALTLANALLTGQTSHNPWWQGIVTVASMIFAWLYSVYAYRRFTGGALLLAAFAWFSLAAGGSMLIQAEWGVWLGTGVLAAYVAIITLLLMAHSVVRGIRIFTRLEADGARCDLARLHLDNGDPRLAREALLKTSMSQEAGDLLMETARGFERKRDYAGARETYKAVVEHFPAREDASDALADLSSLTGLQPALGSTLVLPDMPVELPHLGRYELSEQLGKGAMGVVYLARDPKIQREVAIKTLRLDEVGDDDIHERFFREAETAGQLHHPNIVTIFDVGEEEGLAYIAMDYVPGGTLADWTHEDELLELPQLYTLMHQIASALAYAHDHRVIHRDIKPGNILFNPDNGTVKVTDFGIARLSDYSKTKTGAILGSPYYMSPEQVAGKKVGPESDIYSLGVSFYQLLCGQLPFDGDSLTQLAWQITNKPHKPIGKYRKGLPRSATRILNKALQKEPDDRFTSAAEMADAFLKGAKSV